MNDREREEKLARALADFHDSQVRGERVDPEQFCLREPAVADELRSAIQALEAIEASLDPAGNRPAAEQPAERMPESLSGCKVLGEIGSGGMGRVLSAYDERLRRKVAIKTLSPRYRSDRQLRLRFMHEARAMARINHPNIARIYSLGPDGEEPHFVMEFLEGAPLTEAARALSMQQKAALMHKVARAVEHLHRNRIVHRDLKPANILVGADLEPKVLDFGLALETDEASTRVSSAGEIAGTPEYFSPEQARGGPEPVEAPSDVFSLGAVFYEVLTGAPPFHAENYADLLAQVEERDPLLPRRLNPAVPSELQNVCLKALEKKPADRYPSARELADDLQRFLTGDPVLASPAAPLRVMTGKIDQHLRELEGWRRDGMLSDSESDSFRRLYDRLVEREDAWIMEMRRLTLSRVTLYLGAWILVVGAALLLLFSYRDLRGPVELGMVLCATASTTWLGIRSWNQGRLQVSIAYLLAACLLAPVLALVIMHQCGWLTAPSLGDEDLELFAKFSSFRRTTNTQLWWAILAALPGYYWLRRYTRSSVFSLVASLMGSLLCLVTLLRMGMIRWLDTDPGLLYLRLIPFAVVYFAGAFLLERLRHTSDSRYFYPVAVIFALTALSGIAAVHKPLADWLAKAAPWTRGRHEYLFILNAGVYTVLQSVFDRLNSAQTRVVAKAFRFVIPGHVLTSLLLLGLAATQRWNESPEDSGMRLEARIFEVLLPVAAAVFVFSSIPKQMKNFFATGLFFLAIGIVRLQQNLLKDRSAWPLALLAAGVVLMLSAANYPPLRMFLARVLGRRHARTS